MEKTSIVTRYPEGQEPDFQVPATYDPDKRFLLSRRGARPLVAICMNPSVASDDVSDRTVNRVIRASERLGYDGWCIINTYPARGTYSKELGTLAFDEGLAQENCDVVMEYLRETGIKEVWGAWGNPQKEGDPVDRGKRMLLERFRESGIRVFYFGGLTKKGNPRHPLYLKIEQASKGYLEIER